MSENYTPTDADRMRVCRYVYAGFKVKDIAEFLRIDTGAVKKHFKRELKDGASLLAKWAKVQFAEQAMLKNSVPALKVLAGMGPDQQKEKPPAKDVPNEPKAPALGKKEQRKLAAKDAAKGAFETPKPPKFMNGSLRTN